MSYIIIDSAEVIAGFARIKGHTRPTEGTLFLQVRHPLIVQFFKNNFQLIWTASVKLKEANTVNHSRLAEIKERLQKEERDKEEQDKGREAKSKGKDK